MKRKKLFSKKSLLSLCMIVILLFTFCLPLSVSAENSGESAVSVQSAESENLSENDVIDTVKESGSMNLDVVFVLDASGSMCYSDPDRVALDALKMFVDLCDDSCSVGYVVYTQNIEAAEQSVNLRDQQDLNKLRDQISKINYVPNGDADIALGLTKAASIVKSANPFRNDRKKAIILLSNGNTYLPHGPRTVEASKKELNNTLLNLQRDKIPVYSIGLNYDGSLNKEELQNISDKTNAKVYETKSSADLPEISSDIFSSIYSIGGQEKKIENGDVEIDIKDNSVFYVNIIINSKLDVHQLDPVLTSPSGTRISLTNNTKVKMTSTGSYTLIKMIYPEAGKWNLHLEHATNENCKVTQLDFISIYVRQVVPKTGIMHQKIKVEATLNEASGLVKDEQILNDIKMVAVFTMGGEKKEVELTKDSNYTFVGEFVPDRTGSCVVKTVARTDRFEKESKEDHIEIEAVAAAEESVESTTENKDEQKMPNILLIVIVVVLIAVVLTIAIFVLKKARQMQHEANRAAAAEAERQRLEAEKNRPRPKPIIEKPIVMPKPTDPDYVKIRFREHGDIRKIIKKGVEDPFNKKAEDYKTSAYLESIIKKGVDDPFERNADSYQIDPSLASIIKAGEDNMSGVHSDAQIDPSLAAIIKAGEDGLEQGVKPEEDTDSDDEGNI